MRLHTYINGTRPLDRQLPELTQDALSYLNSEGCPLPERDRPQHRRTLSAAQSHDEHRKALEALKEALMKVLVTR